MRVIFQHFSKYRAESGATLVGAAIIVPVMVIMAVVVFDLARLYVNSIYAREIALLAAKLSNSSDPEGYAFLDSELPLLKHYPPGEDVAVTAKRQAFWDNQLDSTHSNFWGLDYFPSKDKKVLNLAYRFALDLNPRMYFPIPEPLSSSNAHSELGNRVNCSIEIDFANGHAPPAQGGWPSPGDALNAILNLTRDRIINVTCAVPMIGLRLAGFSDSQVKYVTASAYAHEAGNIRE